MDREGDSVDLEGEASGRMLITRFFEAAEHGDFEAMRELTNEDVSMTWPQSSERFRGRDNAFAAMQTAPDESSAPEGEPQIIGSGDVWVVMMPLRYGQELRHYVGVFQLRNGRIGASTEYFAEPLPPDPARAPFAEPA